MADRVLTIRKAGYSSAPWRFFLDGSECQLEAERVDLPGAPPVMPVMGYDTKALAVEALCRTVVRLIDERETTDEGR